MAGLQPVGSLSVFLNRPSEFIAAGSIKKRLADVWTEFLCRTGEVPKVERTFFEAMQRCGLGAKEKKAVLRLVAKIMLTGKYAGSEAAKAYAYVNHFVKDLDFVAAYPSLRSARRVYELLSDTQQRDGLTIYRLAVLFRKITLPEGEEILRYFKRLELQERGITLFFFTFVIHKTQVLHSDKMMLLKGSGQFSIEERRVALPIFKQLQAGRTQVLEALLQLKESGVSLVETLERAAPLMEGVFSENQCIEIIKRSRGESRTERFFNDPVKYFSEGPFTVQYAALAETFFSNRKVAPPGESFFGAVSNIPISSNKTEPLRIRLYSLVLKMLFSRNGDLDNSMDDYITSRKARGMFTDHRDDYQRLCPVMKTYEALSKRSRSKVGVVVGLLILSESMFREEIFNSLESVEVEERAKIAEIAFLVVSNNCSNGENRKEIVDYCLAFSLEEREQIRLLVFELATFHFDFLEKMKVLKDKGYSFVDLLTSCHSFLSKIDNGDAMFDVIERLFKIPPDKKEGIYKQIESETWAMQALTSHQLIELIDVLRGFSGF